MSAENTLQTCHFGSYGFPPTPFSVQSLLILFIFFAAPTQLSASESTLSKVQYNTTTIEEVIVYGSAIGRPKLAIHELNSVNHIDLEQLRRRQPNDVFEALDFIPGLSIEGGMRTRGKSFSIRGFSNNEDILLLVDGVPQNFEKYRSGSSVEIEPELLKELAVFRGGASINQGAGYIGGAIPIETKDASDFLSDDKRYGTDIKLGWNTNNRGQRYLLTAYARPTQQLDTIISVVKRQTDDYRLPNKKRIEDSNESKLSGLAKIEYVLDDFDIALSYRDGRDEVQEPFDVQNGSDALFGTVRRETQERATTLRLNWRPKQWLNLSGILGNIDKTQIDIGGNLSGGCPGADLQSPAPDYDSDACGRDKYKFDIQTARIENSSEFETGNFLHKLDFGIQATIEQRKALRAFRDQNGTVDIINVSDDFRSAVIENYNQPSGEKITEGVYINYELNWHQWRLSVGTRYDDMLVAPKNAETIRLATLRGIGQGITFRKTTPAASVSFNDDMASVFYHYRENFRPPLADELYSRNLLNNDGNVLIASFLNRCQDFASIFLRRPDNVPSITDPQFQPITLQTLLAFEAAIDAFYAQIADFNASNEAYKRNNAFCGDLYRPEESVTQEVGFILNLGNMFDLENTLSTFKLTYFDIHSKYLLESIEEVNGQIVQPGEEQRHGFEIELHFETYRWFGELNYSNLRGYELGLAADQTSKARFALNNPPADSVNILSGWRFFNSEIQIGTKLKLIKSRKVNNAALLALARERDNTTNTSGYAIAGLFAHWYPSEHLSFNITIDNLLNKEYALRGFQGAKGEAAPGRDYRLSVSYSF